MPNNPLLKAIEEQEKEFYEVAIDALNPIGQPNVVTGYIVQFSEAKSFLRSALVSLLLAMKERNEERIELYQLRYNKVLETNDYDANEDVAVIAELKQSNEEIDEVVKTLQS